MWCDVDVSCRLSHVLKMNIFVCLRATRCYLPFGSCLSKASSKHQLTNETSQSKKKKRRFRPLTHVWLIYANYFYQSEVQRNDSCFYEAATWKPARASCRLNFCFFFLLPPSCGGRRSANVDWRLVSVLQKVSPVRKRRIGPFAWKAHTDHTRTHIGVGSRFGRLLSSLCRTHITHTDMHDEEMFSLDRQIFKHELILTHVTFRVNSI